MEDKSISMYIVPSVVSEIPGEFVFYISIVDYENNKPVIARTIMQKHVNFPGPGDSDELDWAIEVCDFMYQELTAWKARVKRGRDTEVNARPADTTNP